VPKHEGLRRKEGQSALLASANPPTTLTRGRAVFATHLVQLIQPLALLKSLLFKTKYRHAFSL
jgi:hypothetical protein